MAFIILLSAPNLFKGFIMKGCYILTNAFSASIEMTIWFLFLIMLVWYMYHSEWFSDVEPSDSEVLFSVKETQLLVPEDIAKH